MTKFADLELKPEVQRALRGMKYTDLTPIQEQTFAYVMEGRDVLARAETGSGKTSACAVPLMQVLDPSIDEIQALILVPTRELALQYVDEISQLARYSKVVPFAVFGGLSIELQKTKLTHGVHVLVATPGRLIDLLYNSKLALSGIRTVVLDEADEMLKMGFIDDVNFIMSCMIQEHQTLFFSATMPPEIKKLVKRYLKSPAEVELNIDQVAPVSLQHHFQYVGRGDKFGELVKYLNDEKITQTIIFSNSRTGGEKLFDKLKKKFDSVEFIHGGIDQGRRMSIFNRFKKNKIKVMVATDVAGRGLDFSHVSHVINYDFPRTAEVYTHRTGRTGRMGRTGIAMTFVGERERRELRELLRARQLEIIWRGEPYDLERKPKKRSNKHSTTRRRRPARQRRS